MERRTVVIGAGFAGIGMAARLVEAGRDVTVLEASPDVGGTWRHNDYPGAGCDVPSHLYSFSFAPSPDWERRYGTQPEILRYLERVTDESGVRPHLRTSTEVTSAAWHDGVWMLTTSAGDTLEAEALVSAVGQLNRPSIPTLPGADRFEGEAFHSARWRHDVELAGRRVGVVGTGASAIQFVPPVARTAARTSVFQRSAPYTIAKHDPAYSRRRRSAYADIPGLLRASRAKEYVVHEARGVAFVRYPWLMRVSRLDWQRKLRAAVSDASLRDRLTPDYAMGCKRLLLTNEWYDTMQREDVDLVTDAISEVVADGIVTVDGRHHPLDVIVYGTGFTASDFLVPMTVTGRDGLDLQDVWVDGARAHLGTVVPGFPNLFLLYGPQTNLGHTSIIYMIESQIGFVTRALDSLDRRGEDWLDVRPEVQRRWDEEMRVRSRRTVWESGCRSWYTTSDGRNVTNWPGLTLDFRRRLRRAPMGDFVTGRSAGARHVAADSDVAVS